MESCNPKTCFILKGREVNDSREGRRFAGAAGKITVVFPEMNLDSNFAMLLKWFL